MSDVTLHHLVSQFLYREARLLDERDFDAWLDLWTDDATYLIPTTWVSGFHDLREASDAELHHLRAGRSMLDMRVQKLTSGLAWAEEPASRTVRAISNVEVETAGDALHVRSNVVLHRVRHTDDVEVHAGTRSDVLVPMDGSWRIAKRRVLLAHGVLRTANLEFFL